MIALFKQKSPGNIAVLLIFGLLIKLPIFLYPTTIAATENDTFLYQFIDNWFRTSGNLMIASVVAYLLIYIQSLIITNWLNEYRMTNKQTFLPAMAYLLITSLLPEWNYLSAPLLASTFVIWGISKLFELYQIHAASAKIFNIGLLIGIASFFFFPSVFFGICFLIGIMILRPFKFNEFLLFLLGVTTLYYFYAVYLFLKDQLTPQHLIPDLSIQVPDLEHSLWVVFSVVFILVPFVAAGFYIQALLRKMLIQARKNWSILLLYLLLAIFIPFINNDKPFTNWVLAMAPFAAFHACTYLYPPRKWVPVFLFFAVVAFILVQQYVTNTWQLSINN